VLGLKMLTPDIVPPVNQCHDNKTFSSLMNKKQWFAVRAKPRREAYAREQFMNQGYEVYLPMFLQLICHARKKSMEPRPFFPGYLFLSLSLEERNWTKIRSTVGALGAVHFGMNYPPVPDELVRSLKQREDEQGYVILSKATRHGFKPGQKLRFKHGSFEGYEGLLVETRGEDRVLLLLNLLQRQVYSEIPVEELELA